MEPPRSATIGRWCAVAACVTTVAAVALVISRAAPGRELLVAVLVLALLWGLGGSIALAILPRHRTDDRPADDDTEPADQEVRIGTLMHLGGVPDQVARTTSAIAADAGPVALVLPDGRSAPSGLDPSIVVIGADDADELAVFRRRCDAVLLTSARAVPTEELSAAADQLANGADWVQGRAEPLNHDRFGPVRRDALDAAVRRRALDVGLWSWEPDATVVRSELLATHPMEPGRPLGSWLRARAEQGHRGVAIDQVLTRRAAPVAAAGYWPETTARQRAAVADLSDAAVTGRGRARLVAAGLLTRALSGWSVLWWLIALVLLADGSPVRSSAGVLAATVLVSLVLRWLAPHLATGLRPSPFADLLAGLYAMPGSLSATSSALARRIRPVRRAWSNRPLVWLALVATAAAASVVLTARPDDGAATLAAAVAAVLLVLLWAFTVRSLVERSWQRVGFRIPLDLPAEVESCADPGPWRLVDGSPGGFALSGPDTGLSRGDEVTVRVDDLRLHGVVADVRASGGDRVVGVELRTAEPGTAAWAHTLEHALGAPPPTSTEAVVDERADTDRWGRRADRAAIGLVVAASLAVVLVLGLVLVGLRPLVIRSGSMEPTYRVGDVVLVATERAGDVRLGQVVTRFDAPQAADSLTHRVREVSRTGDVVRVTTRGDANDTSEVWSAPADRPVGVVVASVPWIGLPLTEARSSLGGAVLLGALVLGVIAVLFRPRRRTLTPTDELPTESARTTTGGPP
jgi:signal peptidase